MQRTNHLAEFQKGWTTFLSRKGHKVSAAGGWDRVLQSSDSDGRGYRWILHATDSRRKTVTPEEHVTIVLHMVIATEYCQRVYVVIRFMNEINKVLILPADKVLMGHKSVETPERHVHLLPNPHKRASVVFGNAPGCNGGDELENASIVDVAS